MHRFKMFRKATSFAKYGQPAHKELSNCNDKYWPYSYPYTLHQLSNYHRFHNKYKQICSIYICIYNVYLLLLSYIYIYICIYHVFMVNSSSLTQIFLGHVHQRVAQESRDEALSIEGLEPGEAVSIHWSGRTSKMLGLWGKIWKNPIKMI
jgi:hypothetical protein